MDSASETGCLDSSQITPDSQQPNPTDQNFSYMGLSAEQMYKNWNATGNALPPDLAASILAAGAGADTASNGSFLAATPGASTKKTSPHGSTGGSPPQGGATAGPLGPRVSSETHPTSEESYHSAGASTKPLPKTSSQPGSSAAPTVGGSASKVVTSSGNSPQRDPAEQGPSSDGAGADAKLKEQKKLADKKDKGKKLADKVGRRSGLIETHAVVL